jgi:hypothetical protein
MNKQQIQVFFEAGQRPAYRRSREREIGGRGAKCSRLRDGNKYADVIEIGRFAHAQPQFSSTDHSPEEQYLGQERIRHSGDSRQPGDPGHRAAKTGVGKRPFRLNSRVVDY